MMSVATTTGPREPKLHLWTRDEYYRMASAGLFDGKRVELIEGEVLEMSPIKSLHTTGVGLASKVVEAVFGEGYYVRVQQPIDLGGASEPEPDVVVVSGDVRDYRDAHPTTALLIVEVAESSLDFDRTEKARLYARAGIPEYWIENLLDDQLEVRRDPVPDPSQPFGFGYQSVTVLIRDDRVLPLHAPQSTVAVADLLP
ncbi:MAG: hypothetical protein CO095_15410 [Armatimonadetes bacterium CG_4_9_14_3_um_filter_58_7]|nr:MAG: hypothetical protein CO095_15410 [Armatimonadetes bacterium CG_4_9_14_3_um_filter_58_7]